MEIVFSGGLTADTKAISMMVRVGIFLLLWLVTAVSELLRDRQEPAVVFIPSNENAAMRNRMQTYLREVRESKYARYDAIAAVSYKLMVVSVSIEAVIWSVSN